MIPDLEDYNGWADFIRYKMGVNVVPADYKNKVPKVKWKEWQEIPIPHELHEEWKSKNIFKDGYAIILGHVWHNDKAGKFLGCIDTDNQLATDKIALNPDKTLVQQRKNALDRAHSYFYSPRNFSRKPGSSAKDLQEAFDNNLKPKFEVRGKGDVIYLGKHKSGFYYEVVGTDEVSDLDFTQVQHIEQKSKQLCDEYGLNNTVDQPIGDLFREDYQIFEGDNRSRELKRAMCSLLKRNKDILSLDEIKELATKWHNKHCRPPYTPQEGIFERNWKQSVTWIKSKAQEQHTTIAVATTIEPVYTSEGRLCPICFEQKDIDGYRCSKCLKEHWKGFTIHGLKKVDGVQYPCDCPGSGSDSRGRLVVKDRVLHTCNVYRNFQYVRDTSPSRAYDIWGWGSSY